MSSLSRFLTILLLLLVQDTATRSVRRQESISKELNPAPFSNSSLLIDDFSNSSTNSLGFYHGVSGTYTDHDFTDEDGQGYLSVRNANIDGSRYDMSIDHS